MFRRNAYSRIDFFTKKGLPAFSFKRELFSSKFEVKISKKEQLGSLSGNSFFDLQESNSFEIKPRGGNLEFFNPKKTKIGMKRKKMLYEKFKPSGGNPPHRDYDGEIVFYDRTLAPGLKIGLLGSVFL